MVSYFCANLSSQHLEAANAEEFVQHHTLSQGCLIPSQLRTMQCLSPDSCTTHLTCRPKTLSITALN